MLECSGFGGRLVRRSVLVMCISLLTASAVIGALTAGCGDATKSYVGQANQIIYEVNLKANELKKYWVLPLADQGTLSKTLAEFRKLLGSAQNKLDSSHPPQQCLDLDEDVRKVVDKGRELAESYSPFADYYDGVAPLANQMAETVSSLEALQKQNDTGSGVLGLSEKVQAIGVEARSITPPGVFTGMHVEFEHFIESMAATFQNASGEYGASPRNYDYSNTESYNQEQTDETTTPSNRRSSSPRSSTLPGLDNVPDNWASFNAELSNIMSGLQDVVGVKTRNDEFEHLVGMTMIEIKRLEKQHK